MQWLEVCFEPGPGKLDKLAALLEDLGIEGLVIEDGSDFMDFLHNNRQYWDYVDAELLAEKKAKNAIKLYLPDDVGGKRTLDRILKEASPYYTAHSVTAVKDEDWENGWMQYYKPIPVGQKLLIVPEWEDTALDTGRTVLRLNPGLIFGTGSHPTTAMCLEALEPLAPKAETLLDLGCGSGILAVASVVLGCKHAVGCDIDPMAPKTVLSNAALNAVPPDALTVFSGDILGESGLHSKISAIRYDLIMMNIVADVIIAFASSVPDLLKPNGRFICSGIIEGRQNEVISALSGAGLQIVHQKEKDDWHCFTARIGNTGD